MTTDQTPWRAEMPKVYDAPPPWIEGCCDSESVWHLVVDANANVDMLRAELDAARARIAEMEAAARRGRATTLEFIEEMEGTRKALHEEKNRTHSLTLRISELEASQQWRPMETAPRDETEVAWLTSCGERFVDCWRGYWERFPKERPIAWLPLPEPPKEEG